MERKDILIIAALIRKIVREEIAKALQSNVNGPTNEQLYNQAGDQFGLNDSTPTRSSPPRNKTYATTPNIRAIAELVGDDDELDESVDISMFMKNQQNFDKIINAKVSL